MASIELPASGRCQVWLDFDGTVSRQDVLDELILRHSVDQSWKVIEQRWQGGEIGSRQCLTEQLALVRVTAAELDALLGSIDLDPGARALFQLLEARGVPLAILSDCLHVFILRILTRHGFGHLTVRANAAEFSSGGVRLLCPHQNPRCLSGAAHCKCASMKALAQDGRQSIYVGDGRSDLCAARKASLVFAKGVLARCLDGESLPYVRYATLTDVADFLAAGWPIAAARAPGQGLVAAHKTPAAPWAQRVAEAAAAPPAPRSR